MEHKRRERRAASSVRETRRFGPKLGPKLRRTRASWLQFGPNLSTTGPNTFGHKLGLTCATLPCVGASGAEVGPKTGPNVGNTARHNPHRSQKKLEIAVKNASLQLVIESAKVARVGPTKLRYLDATRTQVGANGSC